MRPDVSELEFEKALVDAAHLFGWRVASFRPALHRSGKWATPVKYDGTGWPDLALVHRAGFLILAELKSATGRLSSEQREWGDAIAQAIDGIEHRRVLYAVWRPADWDSIMETLQLPRKL